MDRLQEGKAVVSIDLMADADRQKFNLELPVTLKKELDHVAQRWGPKRKWLSLSAAIVAFLEMSEEAQNTYVRRVSDAEMSITTYAHLLDYVRAKGGSVRATSNNDPKVVPSVKPLDPPSAPTPAGPDAAGQGQSLPAEPSRSPRHRGGRAARNP